MTSHRAKMYDNRLCKCKYTRGNHSHGESFMRSPTGCLECKCKEFKLADNEK